jgi:hypothetical protein
LNLDIDIVLKVFDNTVKKFCCVDGFAAQQYVYSQTTAHRICTHVLIAVMFAEVAFVQTLLSVRVASCGTGIMVVNVMAAVTTFSGVTLNKNILPFFNTTSHCFSLAINRI